MSLKKCEFLPQISKKAYLKIATCYLQKLICMIIHFCVLKRYSQSVLIATNYFVKFTSYGLLTSDILLYCILHSHKQVRWRKRAEFNFKFKLFKRRLWLGFWIRIFFCFWNAKLILNFSDIRQKKASKNNPEDHEFKTRYIVKNCHWQSHCRVYIFNV